MLYFNNQELAATYHVSVRTVRNWIESARSGKLDLSLHTKGERMFVSNTSKNIKVIEELVKNGKKYRPHRSQKMVAPHSKFYELFSQEQIYDIVSNLEINRELPRQYNYFGEGAYNWDEYVKRLSEEDSPNSLTSTINLLTTNRKYLDNLTRGFKQVNIIDVGVGNAFPVRGLLTHLLEQGKLGRYIALDISPTMIDIAKTNLDRWFGDRLQYESHIIDVEHDRFGNILAEEYIKTTSRDTTNLILFFGGTLANFKRPGASLQIIHDSMGLNDFLIIGQKLDTKSTRRYFQFDPASSSTPLLAPIHRYIFDLLNIDTSLYEVNMGFDNERSERNIRIIFKIALSIRFKFDAGERIISFDKGDSILLWRARQSNVLDVIKQLTDSELYPLQVSQAENQEYILTISRIKRD